MTINGRYGRVNVVANDATNIAGKKFARESGNGKQSTFRAARGAQSGHERRSFKFIMCSLILITILALSVSALTISISGTPTKSVSLNGARIEWNTDIAATGRVDYGKTPALGQVKELLTFVTFHRIDLDDLQANTKYYYKITSIAQNGDFTSNDNGGAMFTLNTNAGADAVAPVFSDLRPLYFGDTTTTFAWTTNEPATSVAYFGKDELATVSDNALVLEHVLVVPTQSGQMYHFNIAGCDAYENCANGSALYVLAGAQNGIPSLTADIPAVISTNKLTIRGTTRPFATIEVFLDGVKRHTLIASGDGTFVAPNVLLTSENSTIKLAVTDVNSNKVEQSYTVSIDNTPPNVKLNKIPDIADSSPLTISGSVDEPVIITYEVKKSFDNQEPDRVSGVKTTDVEANTISLTWTESPEDDVREYAVYRDGIRITTVTDNEYDDAVSSGATYSYRVSAVDQSCNEGAFSDSLIVKSANGGNTFTGTPKEAVLTCTTEKQTLNANGQFSFSLGLEDGTNQYKISVADLAGNVDEYEGTVRLDSTAPTFIETNLDRLSPTYIPEVTVQGQVSEPATVFVYVNGETTPQAYEVTDDEGNFKIKVQLKIGSTSINSNDAMTGNVVLEAGVGVSTNKIRLEAVDLAGLKATQGPVEVKYALCGEGGAYDVDMGAISPSILTPRLIVEGVQQIGFPINLSYRGAYKSTLTKKPSLRPLELSLESEADYDTGWVQYNFIQSRDKNEGYVQLSFPAQPPEDGQSTPEKENELFKHRIGECSNPAAGCAKFLFQLNIEYQEDVKKPANQLISEQTTGSVSPVTQTQKVCIPIEVQMDKPINLGDKIPKKLYEKTSQYMGDAIEIIDKILKPLTVIGEYTIYSCFALTAVNYVLEVYELVECDYGKVAGLLGGKESKFDRKVAEIGRCDQVYTDKDAKEQCNDCYKAVRNKLNLKDAMREVCDRVACPAAPTLQTYIKQKADGPAPKIVSAAGVDPATGQAYYSGSSCALTKEKAPTTAPTTPTTTAPKTTTSSSAKTSDLITADVVSDVVFTEGGGSVATASTTATTSASTSAIAGGQTTVSTDYNGIKQQYKNYVKHKEDTSTQVGEGATNKEGVNCAGPHAANAECCGSEYYEEWNSACGLPGVYAETFNEIKESACLAAQTANQVPAFEKETQASCGGLLGATGINIAYTGLCDSNSFSVQPEFMQTHVNYNRETVPSKVLDNGEAIIMITPDASKKKYDIYSGYATLEYSASPEDLKKVGDKKKVDITQSSKYIKLLQLDVFNTFDPTPSKRESQIKAFADQFCGQSGFDAAQKQTCRGKATEIYDRIAAYITTSDKEYIVQPADEGIFRSVQCVCLPAVSGYLQHWRAVLGAIKTCVDHVRITGEGSSGACNELYSNLICDVLYDVLRCFVKGFNTAGSGTSEGREGGIGDIIGVLTKAGANTEQNVQDRYGTSALFKSTFSEGNLVHGACMFAFTGEWDVQVGGLFQQTVKNTPLASTGFVFPAERSYVSYNPSSSPKGLTTWLYHIGVQFVAGADSDYRLYLQCSNSRTCEERDGYRGNTQGRPPGACDCYGQTELKLDVSHEDLKSGRINQNDNLAADIYYTIQAESGVGQVRYDKAVFEYSYKDATGETKVVTKEAEIHLTGADAPNFCSLKLLGTPFFSCTFGGDYVGAAFRGEPKVLNPPLLLEKQGQFSVPIDFMGSSDPRETGGASSGANTKYLVYEVKNGANTVVETNKPTDPYSQDKLIRIETAGLNDKLITMMNPLKDSMFGGTSGESNILDSISYWDSALSGKDTQTYGDARINPGASGVSNARDGSLVNLLFVWTSDSSVIVYRAAETKSSTNADGTAKPMPSFDADGNWGYWRKAKAIDTDTKVENIGPATLSGKVLTYKDEKSGGTVTITFLNPADVPKKGAELWLRHTVSSGSGTCARFSATPDVWHVTFKLFDAKKTQYGATYEPNYNQPTTDAEGVIQERTIAVDALCSKTYAGSSGYPVGVLPCKVGEKSEMANGCFCGTVEKANECIPGTQCHNCGPDQTLNQGKNYCNKDAAGTFTCDAENKPIVPTILEVLLVPNDGASVIDLKKTPTVTLTADIPIQRLAIHTKYTAQQIITLTLTGYGDGFEPINVAAGEQTTELIGPVGVFAPTIELAAGTVQGELTVADAADSTKKEVFKFTFQVV